MVQDYSSRRTQVLINKAFQFRQMALFVAINFLMLLLFSFFFYLFFGSELKANLASAHASYRSVWEMILPILLALGVINLFISSLLIILFVLFASHKIAGPLYRFQTWIDELGKRNFQTVTSIRERDQLHPLSLSLKQTTEVISEDIRLLTAGIGELRGKLSASADSEECRRLAHSLYALLSRYRLPQARIDSQPSELR
jgi:hypothetical protein